VCAAWHRVLVEPVTAAARTLRSRLATNAAWSANLHTATSKQAAAELVQADQATACPSVHGSDLWVTLTRAGKEAA
jgi:hypothetical protein